MNYRIRTGLLIAMMAGSVTAAEPLPYGHRDFVPTPEHPAIFRPNNGWYSGATPPLEWWEGTPAQIDGKVHDRWNYEKLNPAKLWDFADTKSKNILWKAPIPGWSLSHPIVVGKKVFAVGEPDFVTCFEADTGKVLWQRRMMPLLFDGLDEKQAESGQKVVDLARALFLVSSSGPSAAQQHNNLFAGGLNKARQLTEEATKDPAAFLAGKRESAAKLVRMIEKHRPDAVAFGDAVLLKALDDDLAILKPFQEIKSLDEFMALAPGKPRSMNLVGACQKKLGIDIGGCWWGYVGSADSTLASDGKAIYGVFDQGQVFALDLDGKLLWGHREKGRHDNRGVFHRSPLLCDGKLMMRSLLTKRSTATLRALEVSTGKVAWEMTPVGESYTVPRVLRLTGSAGVAVDVLITDVWVGKDHGPSIIRVADGKVLGHLPYSDTARGAVMAILGDQVTWSSTSDSSGGPTCSYRLRLAGADQVEAEKVFVLDGKERIFGNQGDFPTVAGKAWLYQSQLFDATTGKLLSKLPVTVANECAVVAGRYLIAHMDAGRGNNPWVREREDHKAIVRYAVIDVSDPTQPKLVSDRNLLGHAEPAADIIVKNYLSEFDPYDFAGCYKGSQSFFALMSGPVPHGDRLYIQSSAFLYCIGAK